MDDIQKSHTEVPIIHKSQNAPQSYGSEAMVIVYCWLCDGIAERRRCAPHYESERPVYFCGAPHMVEYLWLLRL
jgi:hypothetical protein